MQLTLKQAAISGSQRTTSSIQQKGIFVVCTLSIMLGCTQHHSLQTNATLDSDFFGASNLAGEQTVKANQLQKIPESTGFSYSSVECDTEQSLGQKFHFVVTDNQTNAASEYDTSLDAFAFQQKYNHSLPLSPGDMIQLSLVNGEGFAGNYIVNPGGHIQLPYLPAISVAGKSSQEIAEQIELALVRAEMFKSNSARVGIRVLHWAPIEVSVAGAVFEPGRVLINRKIPAQEIEQRVDAYGDYSPTRYLSEALRAASGIRPDANVKKILLIRQGWQIEVDLSGILTGMPTNDLALVAGDQVIVPTTGCFQHSLVKPSQITPKGFRVFMSNLIDSARSNANAAIGSFSSQLPYGSRLLQAAISANCVGGSTWTNAPRKIVLVSNNPLTGKNQMIERSVELLVREAHDEFMNPYLMPNDAVACYDSDATNLQAVGKALVDIISPLKLL